MRGWQERELQTIFETIRVIDLTQGMAGPLVSMILADYGADVIRIEPPGGDPMWEHPAYRLWNRGKKSVAIEWEKPAGRAAVRQLIEGADIFLESLGPGVASGLGLDDDELRRANPALVTYALTAFGQTGPSAGLGASDGIVNAKSGRMRDQIGWQRNRPTYRAVNDISYHTAMFAVQAIVAALRVRIQTGRGQRLEGTLLSGASAPNNNWRLFAGQDIPEDLYPGELPSEAVKRGELTADRHESDPYTANPSQICLETKDGRWIMHSHIQKDLFDAWIDAIGFSWIRDDPRYKDAPLIPDDKDRIELNLMIFEAFRQKTAQEWREIYRAHPDCAGEVMQTTQEALDHEQFRANGHVVTIEDPVVGPMEQIGSFAKMSRTPARVARGAPIPGEHTQAVLAQPRRAPPQIEARGGGPAAPLEGITVLECASWLAAPFSGALLADLGARVIKVEPLSGDPYRRMPTNENMIRAFQGKKNISLNLKCAKGLRIFHDLVKQTDLLLHNYRPGVPERLGIDYETLSKINPGLVYLYAGSYGSEGPDRHRAAFNPTMGAFSGNSVFQSGRGNRPKGDQSPDPIAGSGVATGLMLGLAAKLLTGQGQYIETSMMVSNVYCNSDDAFSYEGKPDRQVPDRDQLGLEATYRLYETGRGWIFLSARFDNEFERLATALDRPDLLRDERYGSWHARKTNAALLGIELGMLFRTRSADDWERLLTPLGVDAVRADRASHVRYLHSDPQVRAIDFMVQTRSAAFEAVAPGGGYWRHAPVVRFSDTPCVAGLPYEGQGVHTREIMKSIGLDDAAIDSLLEAGAIAEDADHGSSVRVREPG